MKKNIIIKSLAAVLMAGSLASCSDDYLDLAPITNISEATVTETTTGALYGLYGICASMNMPYSANGPGMRFMSGESWVTTFYGEVPSPDAFYWTWAGPGNEEFQAWKFMSRSAYTPAMPGWMYYYNLINQANHILVAIDNAEGTEGERQYIKAGCLTMRAHAYTQLMKIYGPRWSQSNNGEKYVLVLRTTPGTEGAPLATCNTIMKLIYDDLDTAIDLYGKCGINRTHAWEPDVDVARGIYARAAMVKNDWVKAEEMAKEARKSYPIMSAEAYAGGFAEPTSEYMWNCALDETMCYYWSWGATNACNGAYVYFWGYGAGSASWDLLKQLDPKDVRGQLFFSPDRQLSRPLQKSSFWNKDICEPTSMNLNKNANMVRSINVFAKSRVPNPETYAFPFAEIGSTEVNKDCVIPFGAQLKFLGIGQYSTMCLPYMRSAELLLYQAEAIYRQGGRESEVQALLTELNSKRIEGYSCSKTGDDLWQEVMLTSRIETWGEGLSWFNMKRWDIPVERRAWVAGDMNSSNFPAEYAVQHPANDQNGWRWMIPQNEFRYNKEADLTLMDYSVQ